MQISILKEVYPGEMRAAADPVSVGRLAALGADVVVESGLGTFIGASDVDYEKAGARVDADRSGLIRNADVLVRIRKPSVEDTALLRKGCVHISFLDPFNEGPLVDAMASAEVTAVSLELIPRITRAQKMDVLSSQASLGGYAAVITAAEKLRRIFPMMMTPAGTIAPARVFVIGAGVAGLQAIATAKRLGARVDAFDTRPVVEEQVQSLGAKFVKVDMGETGQTEGGYARKLTEEQLEKQRQVMARYCAQADVVITTAQVFGGRAPIIVTEQMLDGMRSGAVVVDMAVESGGNVQGIKADQITETKNGVVLVGLSNLPAKVCADASRMLASNVFNLIDTFWDKEKKALLIDMEDDILKGCVVTHDGSLVNETVKSRLEKA